MYVKSSTLFLGDTLKSKDIFGVMLGVIFSTDQSTTSHPNLDVLKSKMSFRIFFCQFINFKMVFNSR
jgi:hypothetical protein